MSAAIKTVEGGYVYMVTNPKGDLIDSGFAKTLDHVMVHLAVWM